jgi:membrane associated rhomboid family serine protease
VSYNPNPGYEEPAPRPSSPNIAIPLHQPIITYILLGVIVVVWLLMELAGGSTRGTTLVRFGANYGPGILLEGEIWRLFTSMFLHIGFMHLIFNGLALFSFGVEMERLYGPDRYLVIYILSGLFGSLVSFASKGPEVLSAGASGAIFGVIGMNLAFFLLHRDALGQMARQRMQSTIWIIIVNLIFGFTVPGIDNMAHLGGLIAGFALGYGLAPRYQITDAYTGYTRLVDTVTLLNRAWVPVLGLLVLGMGIWLSLIFWGSRLGGF